MMADAEPERAGLSAEEHTHLEAVKPTAVFRSVCSHVSPVKGFPSRARC